MKNLRVLFSKNGLVKNDDEKLTFGCRKEGLFLYKEFHFQMKCQLRVLKRNDFCGIIGKRVYFNTISMSEDLVSMKKICIVDDNKEIRDIYRTKFESEGFAVIDAEDGEKALEIIKSERPDAILLDIQMPVLDGFGVLKALKSDAELAKIPVVMFSNVDSDEIFQTVSNLGGAQYYLIKALTTPQKVVDIVSKALTKDE